jgi:cytosine/adenosine deaminase-related metal-dependent hydrolase
MLESEKVANIIHKHVLCDPGAAWVEVPEMLFANNALIAGRSFNTPLGVLAPGAAADIAVFDYNPLTPMTADNANGHILFGVSGKSAVTTIIDGVVRMKDRELLGVDEERIMAKCREHAGAMAERINSR